MAGFAWCQILELLTRLGQKKCDQLAEHKVGQGGIYNGQEGGNKGGGHLLDHGHGVQDSIACPLALLESVLFAPSSFILTNQRPPPQAIHGTETHTHDRRLVMQAVGATRRANRSSRRRSRQCEGSVACGKQTKEVCRPHTTLSARHSPTAAKVPCSVYLGTRLSQDVGFQRW
jgi:hypothetical protein